MTNSDWWDRAKQPPRPQPIEIRTRETILAGAVLLVREPRIRARRVRRPRSLTVVADLQSAIPEYRRSAAAFMARREDFDQFWCALVGLDGDAVRERLSEPFPHHEDAA